MQDIATRRWGSFNLAHALAGDRHYPEEVPGIRFSSLTEE